MRGSCGETGFSRRIEEGLSWRNSSSVMRSSLLEVFGKVKMRLLVKHGDFVSSGR